MKTTGQILFSERKRQKRTLEEISTKTKIPIASLTALEMDDYSYLPSATFIKGFIRNYSQELGLNPEKALAVFRRDHNLGKQNSSLVPAGMAKPLDEGFAWTPKMTIISLSVIVFTVIIGFFFLQVRSYIFTPYLDISSPADGQKINNLSIEVAGKTIPDATVHINDQLTTIGFDGSFSYNLKLLPGENLVKIKAINRRGKEKEIVRRVLVDKP